MLGQRAEESGIKFRCCRSKWVDYDDDFTTEALKELIEDLIDECSSIDVENIYDREHEELKEYIATLLN